jgi:hypothetical protein
LALASCATLPAPNYTSYSLPEEGVFIDEVPSRKFKVLGLVRVRVNFSTLNPERDEQELCRNYYRKGLRDLLARARRERKADAIMDVESVVYYLDGKLQAFKSPECSDDGGEGQILLQAKAIRYLPDPVKKK